jgi:hypothetical protein
LDQVQAMLDLYKEDMATYAEPLGDLLRQYPKAALYVHAQMQRDKTQNYHVREVHERCMEILEEGGSVEDAQMELASLY